ncbi:MAG: sensor histidine kinase [Halioglobus sp.]|nr:sensor histidine kinase [Halioglobus sp.]
MAAILRNLKHIKLLNHLGEYLDAASSGTVSYCDVIGRVCDLLELRGASLWLVDTRRQVLARECLVPRQLAAADELTRLDRDCAESSLCSELLSVTRSEVVRNPLSGSRGSLTVATLQIRQQDKLLGILNLYMEQARHWCLDARGSEEPPEVQRAVSGQLAVFIRNKALESNSTFYKEVHHRVKNNLQTVASLLRMQLRRLDQVSAERALEESINRIQSISLVHETLAKESVGRVDVNQLLQRICSMHGTDPDSQTHITVDMRESIALDSREATAMALVVSELVQNALQHASTGQPLDITVNVTRQDEQIVIDVQDTGPGLPDDFDPARSDGLGLTIVRTLVNEELHGEFELLREGGTIARVTFTLPPLEQIIAVAAPA